MILVRVLSYTMNNLKNLPWFWGFPKRGWINDDTCWSVSSSYRLLLNWLQQHGWKFRQNIANSCLSCDYIRTCIQWINDKGKKTFVPSKSLIYLGSNNGSYVKKKLLLDDNTFIMVLFLMTQRADKITDEMSWSFVHYINVHRNMLKRIQESWRMVILSIKLKHIYNLSTLCTPPPAIH